MTAYSWPSPEAVAALNALLDLPATGHEQSWECELADASRIAEFLSVYQTGGLDFEGRSALALLILFSVTYSNAICASADLKASIRWALCGDPEVRDRMKSYWSRGFNENEGAIERILR